MIFIEDELVKVNGVVLPGLVKSIEVTEAAQIDEQEVEGSATKPKQATGYQDATVKIELIIDDTATKPSTSTLQQFERFFARRGRPFRSLSRLSARTQRRTASTKCFLRA